jgi:transcriptional regulator with XRE-family HTH domain
MHDTGAEDSYQRRVAAEVRALLARRKLSQRHLARELGYTQPRINRRVNGDVPFAVDELYTIACVLGVEPRDLLPISKENP